MMRRRAIGVGRSEQRKGRRRLRRSKRRKKLMKLVSIPLKQMTNKPKSGEKWKGKLVWCVRVRNGGVQGRWEAKFVKFRPERVAKPGPSREALNRKCRVYHCSKLKYVV